MSLLYMCNYLLLVANVASYLQGFFPPTFHFLFLPSTHWAPGRKTSRRRMWSSPGLSVLSVCSRPLLWMVCPAGTVSKENQTKSVTILSLCPHSLCSVLPQMWTALGVPAGICAGSVALELQPNTTVSSYPPSQSL